MSRWPGMDRRKFPRYSYPCLVILRNSEGHAEAILTHTENIGTGGICVILKQNLKMFCPVDLELDLLDLGSHIKCQGKIVWNVQRQVDAQSKPSFYDIGIEFLDVGKKEQERLADVVERLFSTQAEPA